MKNSYEKLAFFLIFTQYRAIKVLYFEIKHRKSFRISFTPLGGEVFFLEMTGMLMNAIEPQTQQVGADDTCGSRVYVCVCFKDFLYHVVRYEEWSYTDSRPPLRTRPLT